MPLYLDINTKWKLIKNALRKKLLKNIKNKKQKQEKFVSFFRQSLLPKELIEKYPYLIANTKKEYLTGRFRSTLTPHNRFVIKILMRGFYIIFFALLHLFRMPDIIINTPQVHDISIFNYFNNNYCLKFFFNNNLLQYIIKGNILDTEFFSTFINYYNFYIFWVLNKFYVLFNFEDFKFEEDRHWLNVNPLMLLVKSRISKRQARRMKTDYFYYIKRKNRFRLFNKYIKNWPWYRDAPWNQKEEGFDDEINIKIKRDKKILKDHLTYQDNIFFCYIIYEFALNLLDNFTFNFFNIDFFNKVKIFIKKEKKKILKYPFFLKSTYYIYNMELLAKRTRKKPFLYTNYKSLNPVKKFQKNAFNVTKQILDIKYFGIKMPFLFFLIYTWYSIYFRRMKYNLYIRSEIFFQEHFGKLHYFIWANNAARAGINKFKLSQYKYQKLFTLYHLKTYLEVEWFNNWFFFYMAYHTKFKNYINLNEYQHKSNFLKLLNDQYLINILKTTKEIKNVSMELFYNFFYKMHYLYELFIGYEFFMKAAVTKYEREFRFGILNYLKFDVMIEKIYLVPYDKKRLLRYIETKILFEHYFNIYLNNYSNFYFLTDLYNWKAIKEYQKNLKIINFFDKIFYIIFFLVDPFFFKYYWKRCFPRKWHKLINVMHYLFSNMILIRRVITADELHLNVPKFNLLMYLFFWRVDTSNYFMINNYKSLNIGYDFIAINLIYRTRFIELVKQINFLIQQKQRKYFINIKFFFSYFLIILRAYYFNLLYQNMEYILIFFFLNKLKYYNIIYNNKINFFKDFLYSNFIYRYYIYNILIETHYYKDWFHDWDKRICWIYKNFLNHEGILFYNKKTLII